MVMEFTDLNFDSEVLKSKTPVLVDFWAVWCGPCKMVAPEVEKLDEEKTGALKVGKLNVDENRETAIKYSITSIPTLLLFKDGQMVKKLVGAMSKDRILYEISAFI
ncbi:MAG: thioredoxin [Actinobacteria bacterium]|nr:thioredoxin [Actinomycetota bacterium]